jgi:integrase
MVGSGMPKSYREQRICKTWFCGNPPALLFATRKGGPLSQRNVIRAFYIAGAKCEFHALRRLRNETLRRTRVPEDLIRLWLGHAGSSMTYTYAKGLGTDVNWRQEWANRLRTWVTKGYKSCSDSKQQSSVSGLF